ncbi:MAG TPA: hypothetical protein PKN23_01495 [Candidatus Hydrogenedentes bacterium]|nr:hypothetical protein [Candidatus Hydrogenedentota bacterium]
MIKEWWDVRRATLAAQKVERHYSRTIAKAEREGGDRDEISSLEAEALQFVGEAWEDRDHLITCQLCRQAKLLNLPVPDYDEQTSWREMDPYAPRRILTAVGMTQLRKAIREERQARSLYAKVIFTAVISTIGAIAAIIGAISSFFVVQ